MRSSAIAKLANRLGAVVQGIVLGLLLFAAIVELHNASTAANLFRYQGF